jgi:hypothetical protein
MPKLLEDVRAETNPVPVVDLRRRRIAARDVGRMKRNRTKGPFVSEATDTVYISLTDPYEACLMDTAETKVMQDYVSVFLRSKRLGMSGLDTFAVLIPHSNWQHETAIGRSDRVMVRQRKVPRHRIIRRQVQPEELQWSEDESRLREAAADFLGT